jgi:hypothetical protein
MPFNSASDAFELHPDVALNDGTTRRRRARRRERAAPAAGTSRSRRPSRCGRCSGS